ncbi:hypothetical protein NQ318_010058 [Aromia moschata]|uniref:Transposase n=1 Tax=Aromia moschata TaxID=1265417 RepID=A0AAV8YF46_9CUCU|nr:hypothetical protein NQ318_010058 [Aromia moschata]
MHNYRRATFKGLNKYGTCFASQSSRPPPRWPSHGHLEYDTRPPGRRSVSENFVLALVDACCVKTARNINRLACTVAKLVPPQVNAMAGKPRTWVITSLVVAESTDGKWAWKSRMGGGAPQNMDTTRLFNSSVNKKILFTDESCFIRRGITNLHNQHVFADENPHAIRAKSFNANLDTLFFADLFDDLPLNLRNQMYFMHDGAPPHFARIVREYLNEQFPGRWIGRGNDAPISWPLRSPDLNPCDFFIWGDLKQKVYSVSIENEEQLWNRIQNAVQELQNEETLRRVHFNFLRACGSSLYTKYWDTRYTGILATSGVLATLATNSPDDYYLTYL